MKEYKVGEQIVLEVQEVACSCEYCFFEHNGCNLKYKDRMCSAKERSDGKNVIFVEKKGK